jgi:L-ascorbate metabolism protein UlaG (beta-lactamase superfamily)
MRLTKYTHACVRLENDGRSLLIDPGVYSEVEAFEGVSHVLVTHEHADHVNADGLATVLAANPDLKVYTSAAVAAQLEKLGDAVVTVDVGDRFAASGFAVEVVGGQHAEIYDGLPGCANVGFIVDGEVYHPGDSLFVPATPVSTLLVPTAGPWFKLGEALDFVRAVAPARAFSIHDVMLSPLGEAGTDNWMRMKGQTDYARIPIGSSVEL